MPTPNAGGPTESVGATGIYSPASTASDGLPTRVLLVNMKLVEMLPVSEINIVWLWLWRAK